MQARSKPLKINATQCSDSPPILELDLEGYLDTHTVLEFDRTVNEHLEDNVKAAQMPALPDEVVRRLEAVFSGADGISGN